MRSHAAVVDADDKIIQLSFSLMVASSAPTTPARARAAWPRTHIQSHVNHRVEGAGQAKSKKE